MFKYIFIIFALVCHLTFSRDIPEMIDDNIEKLFSIVGDTQDIRVSKYKTIDMRKLLKMTAMMESRYGQDKYSGRIAKTPFQIEENTAKHYLKTVPILRKHIEDKLGRKLIWNRDEDSVYVAYLIYMSKMRYHDNWIKRYWYKAHGDSDAEYGVYKILYNSLKGKSKYSTWEKRLKEIGKI